MLSEGRGSLFCWIFLNSFLVVVAAAAAVYLFMFSRFRLLAKLWNLSSQMLKLTM